MIHDRFRQNQSARFLLPCAIWFAGLLQPSLAGEATFSSTAYLEHVAYLAADQREGRGLGSEGIAQAGEYIAARFADYGLEPLGDDGTYFQVFEAGTTKERTSAPKLTVRGAEIEAEPNTDFVPMSFTSSGAFEGPVAFAGYGITAPEHDYDDYADFDAKGKVLLMLRYEPHATDDGAAFGGRARSRHAYFYTKAKRAEENGAAAVLIVNPPLHYGSADALLGDDGAGWSRDFGIPMFHVSREWADELLRAGGLPDLETLQRKLDTERKALSADLVGLTLSGDTGLTSTVIRARNVMGLIPARADGVDEYIVVGAHYDHVGKHPPWPGRLRRFRLGRSAEGKGGRKAATRPVDAVYNGADDNASGTAGVIALARMLSQGPPPARPIVLVAFTGEERGLLGSEHFVEHPPVPLEKVAVMINMDMIGRLRHDMLTVSGVDSGSGLRDLITRLAGEHDFDLRTVATGLGPSDHATFYEKKIPVLFFFTGLHGDVHQPGDDVEKINAEGAARVLAMVHETVCELADSAERPAYQRVVRRGGRPRGLRVRLGIRLSRERGDQPGVAVAEVLADTPAAGAGMEAGDRIIALGSDPITSDGDLVDALARYDPGDVAELKLLRDGQELTLIIAFVKP